MTAPAAPPRRSRAAWVVLAALLALGVAIAGMLLPLRAPEVGSQPHRVSDYEEALRRLAALGNDDTCAVAPECRTEMLVHGRRTGRVVVLLHGLTNCPAQFDWLGHVLYQEGANVVIPLIPHHGCADHMTLALGHLDARDLIRFTDRVLDAAAGLGDSVTVVGLSLGGVMAAWAVQERADVDRAVVIAPMFGLALAPGALSSAVARVYRQFPRRFEWWDPRRRERLPGPTHVYPRWSWGSIGETLWLAATVEQAAARRRPAGGSIAMVLVGRDLAIDNRRALAVAATWKAHDTPIETYEFPDSLHLNHDIIDPEQVGANPFLVYPRLTQMILVPQAPTTRR